MYSRLSKIVLCASLALFMPSAVLATNGSLLIGAGAKTRSVGGAGVAMPMEVMSQLINPASSTELGIQAQLGFMFFSPKRSACTNAAPQCVRSGSNLFLLPTMGGAYKFNRRLSLGMAAAPMGGGSTRYATHLYVAGDPNTLGADLKQMNIAIPLAYKVNKKVSLGVAPIIGIQQFRAYGLSTFKTPGVTSDTLNITNRGNDYSYGAGVRVGIQTRFFKGRLNFGANWASRVYMSNFDKYKGLFTENGSFDMPEQFTLGLAVKPLNDLTILFDVTRVYFNDIHALGNPITNSVGTAGGAPATALLGDNGGGGFGWGNQWIYKMGIIYKWNDRLTTRIGANYGKTPLPEDDNLLPAVLAPITTEWHATAGLSYNFSKAHEVSIAYVHAFRNTMSNFDDGQFNISPGGGAKISMVQNSIDFSYTFKF